MKPNQTLHIYAQPLSKHRKSCPSCHFTTLDPRPISQGGGLQLFSVGYYRNAKYNTIFYCCLACARLQFCRWDKEDYTLIPRYGYSIEELQKTLEEKSHAL